MPQRIAAAFIFALFALASPVFAIGAHADDGVPSPSIRPPQGVLRHVDAERDVAVPLAAVAHGQRNEVVLIVGGYQSCSCDNSFADLTRRLTEEGYDVRRFGQDPRFPYDSYGSVAANAVNLRDEARALAAEFDGVHIVTHSGGGVVADQAFVVGLSSTSVATYTAWAGPHSGSFAGRVIDLVGPVADAIAGSDVYTRDLLLYAGWESRSEAMRGIAWSHPVPPPTGVVRLDIRQGTDLAVLARDERDPGVASLVVTGGLDGHGGILSDPRAIDATVQTIERRATPTDDRSRTLAWAAVESTAVDWGAIPLLVLGCGLLACGALLYRFAGGPLVKRMVAERVFGRAHRRRCW